MKTVLMLYARVLGQPLLLLRLGGLMMVILVGYVVAVVLAVESLVRFPVDPDDLQRLQQSLEQNQLQILLGSIVFAMLYVWLMVMFAVRWHRYALLGQSNYRFFDATFGRRGWCFIWKSILIGLLSFVVALPFALVFAFAVVPVLTSTWVPTSATVLLLTAAWMLITLPALYVVGRSSLVFPAIALGFRMRIRDSWDETRGHGLRILLLLVAMSIPTIVGSQVTVGIVPSSGLPLWLTTAIGAFVGVLFVLITTALWASALSHAYQSLNLPLHPPQPQMSGNA